ncbi:MAG: hypothetical protein ABI862_14310 [Ilumatobacteraceae bacterium]
MQAPVDVFMADVRPSGREAHAAWYALHVWDGVLCISDDFASAISLERGP